MAMMTRIRVCALAAATLLCATAAQAALTISNKPTQNMSCSAGLCSATAADAVLNVTDLANLLAASPVTIQSGDLAEDIVFAASFSWKSTSNLTLDAYRSISVNRSISDAGSGALSLTTNDGGTNGTLRFVTPGRVRFFNTSSSLTIDGNSYLLVKKLSSLIKDVAANPSGFYALAEDYNAAEEGVLQTTPIQTLSGVFEGLGNTISNLSINAHARYGIVSLFGQVSGRISNLKLESLDVNGGGRFGKIAGLAGLNTGLLFNIALNGRVRGGGVGAQTGGLVSQNFGIIDHSTVTGLVIGGNDGSEFPSVGGLASGNAGTISNSSAVAKISGAASGNAGGLVGENGGAISSSFATGNVLAAQDCIIGGLVGDNEGTIGNSYALGTAASKGGGQYPYVGGLAAANSSQITASYSIGRVQGVEGFVGGFVGVDYEDGTIGSYWNVQTSGRDQGTGHGDESGLTGLITKQFKSHLPAGFDPAIWAQNPKINNGYPYLIANPPQM